MTNPIHFTTAEEAVKVIKSGDHVHLSSVASAPQCLINAMCKRGEAGELKDVHVHHLHTEGPAPYADPKFEGVFQLDAFFVGANVRKVTQSGYADYIPIFLSETQRLYRCGAVPCNVAMIQVCPPDKHGFVSLGTSVDATLAAVECADYVIAVVNKYVPRAFGQAMIHSSKIDFFVQDDTPLIEAKFSEPNEVETAIGKHCAALIEVLHSHTGRCPFQAPAASDFPYYLYWYVPDCCSSSLTPYKKNNSISSAKTGTRIPSDQSRYPKKDGIRTPFSSAIDLTMKFGAFPM